MISARRLANRTLHRVRELVEWYGAIAPGTDQGDRFGTLGSGSCLAWPQATLFGTRSIHIGEGTLVGRDCTLLVGYTPDDADLPARGLVIGDRCVVGARSTITAHESIELGDDVWTGQDVFISDASHGYQDPETPVGMQLGAHRPVSIGSGTWIGHGAIVLPGTRIGVNCVVGAGTVVRGEVPDHSVVVGVPGRVVRRLVPGVGWVATADAGDVRPVVSAEQMAADLATLVESHPARAQLARRAVATRVATGDAAAAG